MSSPKKNFKDKTVGDSETRYRETLELFPGAAFEMDKEGNIIFASQKAFESFGYNQNDLKEGLNVFQLFIPSDRERIEVNLHKRLEGNSREANEYTALRKDGSTFPIIAQANRIIRENEVVGLRGVFIDITERKKVEEELKRSEKKYRALFEDSPISLWEEDYSELKEYIDALKESGVNDFDKYFKENPGELAKCSRMVQVLDVNKASLVLHKADNKAELLGNIEKYFSEESYDIFKKEIITYAKGNRFHEIEGSCLTLRGEKLYMYLKSLVLPGYENDWSKVLVSVIDISKRKKAEEEIYKFKAITENANFGTAISDLNGNLTYVNKNFAAMHGYGVEEIIGKNLTIFHNDEQLTEVVKINRQLKKTGGFSSKEVWHTRKDGSVFPTLMNGIVINDDKGNPSFMAATAIDITKRKKSERELQASEEKACALMNATTHVAMLTDPDGIILSANESAAKGFGLTPEEFVGKNVFDLLPLEVARKRKKILKTILKNQKPLRFEDDNRGVYFDNSIIPIHDEDGNLQVIAIFAQDITEQKITENRKKTRLNLLDRLRKTDSIDGCLEIGCKAIYEAGLYKRAVLTLHTEDRNITNLGHVGLDEETVKAALNAPAPDDDFTKKLTQKKFRVSNSYFIPEESGVIYSTTARYVPQIKSGKLEDSSWKPKDELFVPLKPGIDRVEGWLSVDTPYDCNRPSKETIIILEEIVDIVGRKVSEIISIEKLNDERKELKNKNIALNEVLGYIETERLKIRKEVSSVINQVMLPLLNKLKNPDGTMDLQYYDLLMEAMNKLASSSNSAIHPYSKLSSREIEICNLIKSGCTSEEISQTLNISITTVHKHRETIRKKLDITNKGINLASYLRNL